MFGNEFLRRFSTQTRIALVCAAVAFAMLAASAQAKTVQAPWRLAVSVAAVVQGERVLLSEIAAPVGDLPPEHWKRLGAIELWTSPAKRGVQEIVSRDKLAKMLKYYLGDVGELCVLSGQLVVQRGGRVVTGPRLEGLVVDSLTRHVSSLGGDVRLRDFRLPKHIFLGDEQSELDVSVAGEFRPGRLSLHLTELDPAGNAGRRYTGTVFMDQWMSVPCAARPINSRDRLAPNQVAYERKNVAYLRGEPWNGSDFGLRAVRPVGAGEVIYAENLEDVPLVGRGDMVNLIFHGRFVRLTTNAKALADGKMGERIAVQNLASRREIIAEVQDANTVVVR